MHEVAAVATGILFVALLLLPFAAAGAILYCGVRIVRLAWGAP